MMNSKHLFSFLFLFLFVNLGLHAQNLKIEELNLNELPSFDDYRPQLPNLSYKDMLYKNEQQTLEAPSSKFNLKGTQPLGLLLEEATIEPDGLLIADGTKYKIRIYQPDVDGLAPMPIVKIGDESIEAPMPALDKYQFKDWPKE